MSISRTSIPSQERYDLVVLGSGIMGMACAFQEALKGHSVAIVDKHALSRKASWAAAGILAARAGILSNSPLRNVYFRSLEAFPNWLKSIESISGLPIPYQRCGDYQIFSMMDAGNRNDFEIRIDQLKRERASAFTIRDELPLFLKPFSKLTKVKVIHYPEEAYINVRGLLESLTQALRKLGVALFQECEPIHIDCSGGIEISGIMTGSEPNIPWALLGKHGLICAGAWSNSLLNLMGCSAPLIPVKGQLALLPNFHGQTPMVHGSETFYLVPRDGHLVAGATSESQVWDETFTAIGDDYLRQKLQTYFAGIQPTWMETWSGIRPRILDRQPLMGWVNEEKNMAICAGHYKCGISMAPLSAQAVSAFLHGEKPPFDMTPYNPFRKGALSRI